MGKYHILFERANGVQDEKGKFYPYKSQVFTATGTLPVVTGRRYYISKIYLSTSNDPAAGALVDKVEATIYKYTSVIAQVTMPITAASGQLVFCAEFNNRVLTDLGTAVSVTIATENPCVIISYAEIDEIPGEYS